MMIKYHIVRNFFRLNRSLVSLCNKLYLRGSRFRVKCKSTLMKLSVNLFALDMEQSERSSSDGFSLVSPKNRAKVGPLDQSMVK